jgi:hypothetical protein
VATNNVTTGKAPRARTTRTKLVGGGNPAFTGDPILEKDAGERMRLAGIKAQTMTGLSTAAKIELLNEAGIRIRGLR